MSKLRIVGLASLGLVVSLSLSGCIIVNNNTTPEVGIPSATPTDDFAVRFPPTGLTQPIAPVEANQLVDCPEMDAINLYDSPRPDEDIVAVNICMNGETYTAMPTNSWASAYRANNADPSTVEACVKMAMDPLIMWVDYGDELVAVYAPQNACGFPQEAAREAYEKLTLQAGGFDIGDGPAETNAPGWKDLALS